MASYCSECGAALQGHKRFCAQCGAPAHADERPQAQAQPEPRQQKASADSIKDWVHFVSWVRGVDNYTIVEESDGRLLIHIPSIIMGGGFMTALLTRGTDVYDGEWVKISAPVGQLVGAEAISSALNRLGEPSTVGGMTLIDGEVMVSNSLPLSAFDEDVFSFMMGLVIAAAGSIG